MKKAAKVEYGITITKPWSKEMYDHNDQVAEAVKFKVSDMWMNALNQLEQVFEDDREDEFFEADFLALDWDYASDEMVAIQRAVTGYRFGMGFTIERVAKEVERDLDNAPYYRLKDIAEDLALDLKKGFIGF